MDIRVVGQEIVQTPIRKVYAPDTTACIFWLKNRRPAEWRDKIETVAEVKGTLEVTQRPAVSKEDWLIAHGLGTATRPAE